MQMYGKRLSIISMNLDYETTETLLYTTLEEVGRTAETFLHTTNIYV